jgi:hypothetical protein
LTLSRMMMLSRMRKGSWVMASSSSYLITLTSVTLVITDNFNVLLWIGLHWHFQYQIFCNSVHLSPSYYTAESVVHEAIERWHTTSSAEGRDLQTDRLTDCLNDPRRCASLRYA